MKTPRTDANESLTCKEGDPCISPDFARQLETELIAMTALADRLAVIADNMTFVAYQPAEVREALAAYENQKQKTP